MESYIRGVTLSIRGRRRMKMDSLKQPPTGSLLAGWSPCGNPGLHHKSRPLPRTFNTRSQKETRGGAPVHVGVSDCKTDNGKNARMHETNTYANEMHMMT